MRELRNWLSMKGSKLDTINTVFGTYLTPSRSRLDLTYDYETSAIFSFFDVAKLIDATAVVDVGANIGVYSIFCLQLPKIDEVHAFEPAPASFDLLKRNVNEQPRRDRVRIYDVAASSSTGTVKFTIVSPMSGRTPWQLPMQMVIRLR